MTTGTKKHLSVAVHQPVEVVRTVLDYCSPQPSRPIRGPLDYLGKRHVQYILRRMMMTVALVGP